MNDYNDNIDYFNIDDFNEEIRQEKSDLTENISIKEEFNNNSTMKNSEKLINSSIEEVEHEKTEDVEINITDSLRKFTKINRNNLFNKIFLGIVIAISIFIFRFIFNTITAGILAYKLSKTNDLSGLEKLPKLFKRMSIAGSSTVFIKYLSITIIIILLYFIFEKLINNQKLKRFFTSANITAITALIMLKISNLIFSNYLMIVKTINNLYKKNMDLNYICDLISNLTIKEPSPALTFFAILLYILTLLLFLLTAYILYLRIFVKKSLKIKLK